MSGREESLIGFQLSHFRDFYSSDSEKYVSLSINAKVLNRLLNISGRFRLDRIEIFNALSIFNRFFCSYKAPSRFPHTVIFLTAVRLSVFWRRRRDILAQNFPYVSMCLQGLNVGASAISEAECEILSLSGCHIWDSGQNVAEVVYSVLGSLEFRGKTDIIKNIAIDICLLISILEIGSAGEESPSVWYDLSRYMHVFFREAGVCAVCLAIKICSHGTFEWVSQRISQKLVGLEAGKVACFSSMMFERLLE